MNECIKTGFMFLDLASGFVRTGDLFCIADLFQVRGVPVLPFDVGTKIDAAVTNCVLAHRANSTYMDSNLGIHIIAPSDEFVLYIKQWYPMLQLKSPRHKKIGLVMKVCNTRIKPIWPMIG